MPCIDPRPVARMDAADESLRIPIPADSTAVSAAALLGSLLARARQERRLLSVYWELTHRCNERCCHCFLPVLPAGYRQRAPAADAHDTAPTPELTTGEAIALIDQVAALGALFLTFTGGEPLLHPDFFTLAAHARCRRLALRIYTNGTLLAGSAGSTSDWPARLAALHPLAVAISLYAATPAVHDAITGVGGSWARTVAALRRLHACGVPTVCKTPLMAANAAELPAVRALAAALGAHFQPDLLITAGVGTTPAQRRAPLAARMTPAQVAAAFRTLQDLAGDRGPGPGTRAGPVLCAIGRSALAVDPYGTVFPCVEVRRALGSIRRSPLAAIWHDLGAWAPYLRLSAGPSGDPAADPDINPAALPTGLSALPVCRTCRIGAWCIRCHGAAANETGDLYGPAPAHCAAARARRALWSSAGPPGPGALPPHATG
jgi:AdoMet-dependent heme synthase